MSYEVDFRDLEYVYTLGSRRVYFPKADAYKGKVINAYESLSKRGNKMLVIDLDITEGIFSDFFKKLYKLKQSYTPNPFWELKCFILLEGDTYSNDRLRRFLFCLETDNKGFKFDWDDDNNLETIKNLNVCFLLEYQYTWSPNLAMYEKRVIVNGFLPYSQMVEGNYTISTPQNPQKRYEKMKYTKELPTIDER